MIVDGCIVRFPTIAGPVLLNDANHTPSTRVTGVGLDANGNLLIHYTPILKVVSAAVTPDDVLADRDISVGASVGLETTVVRFFKAGVPVRADSPDVVHASSNIFVMWISIVEDPL